MVGGGVVDPLVAGRMWARGRPGVDSVEAWTIVGEAWVVAGGRWWDVGGRWWDVGGLGWSWVVLGGLGWPHGQACVVSMKGGSCADFGGRG